MRGDFSRLSFTHHDNFNGVLPQQGKVLLDSDGTAQTLIANDWQQTAGRDWVGPVAGVPDAAPNSFLVTEASLTGGVVTLTVDAGRLWADGLLVRLPAPAGSTSVSRTATWLEPPIVANEGSAADVAVGTVDTVVLEVWQRAVNGFAMPEQLIEPALGGPDTAERLQTQFAFRMARLNAGQTCASVKYNESGRGAMTASLVPPVTVSGDCPLNASGGYSGFEHQLYRIEILDTGGGPAAFKWSRVNGGLAGRGAFDPATQTIAIDANLAAINSYSQSTFYLEIEAWDANFGFTRTVAGSAATLNNGVLQLNAAASQGAYPTVAGDVFFRLWDGTSPVSAYPLSAAPALLENGILLQFDPDGAGKYLPGDYWIFPVRAQGISNPQTLIDAKQPQGIHYHRVPLAEITWASDGAGGFLANASNAGSIEDCRAPLHPISQAQGCCTHRVGDGVQSFGEFTSIQKAVDALPAAGGEVCILPGRYFENVVIAGRADIVIHGCGWQTRVASASLDPDGGTTAQPWLGAQQKTSGIHAVFSVLASGHIEFRDFAIEAAAAEAGVLLDGADIPLIATPHYWKPERGVIDVTLKGLVMTAAQAPAILAVRVVELAIEGNRLLMANVPSLWPAAFLEGREMRFERNLVVIQTGATSEDALPSSVVADLAADAAAGFAPVPPAGMAANVGHPGGIQIGGPSSDVWVLDNEIGGGSRIGVTLGSVALLDNSQNDTGTWSGVVVGGTDSCCTGTLTFGGALPSGETIVNAGLLINIQIHRNLIEDMGLCGIGPVGYFDLAKQDEIISIALLSITQNLIAATVTRAIDTSSTSPLAALFGCGAITVPDVVDLTIRDNTITDFGEQPGVQVSGIFILLGEGVEIAGNQIAETRDWTGNSAENSNPNLFAGGIVLMLSTPPLFTDPLTDSQTPIFEPGVSAVRISGNDVRVALGQALVVTGFGPTSIVNNHLGTGGTVTNSTIQLAQTALVLNFGVGIELTSLIPAPAGVYGQSQGGGGKPDPRAVTFGAVSNGTVLFTNNICQFEARESGQEELTSLFLFTPDVLVFSNNTSWLDAPALTISAFTDALLIGGTLQVLGNRLQEPLESVLVSGIAIGGAANITMQNITTSCLLCYGKPIINANNIALIDGLYEPYCPTLIKGLGSVPQSA